MDFAGRFKKQLESKETNAAQINAGAFGALGLIGAPLLGYATAKQNAPGDESVIDRAVQTEKYFNKDIDPRLKNLYLQQGGYGLQYKSGDILQELIPSTTTPFVPADLSLAGKYKQQLEGIKPANYQADIITVTPGPNPSRFATPELTSVETGPGGAKGYIWGNPEEPQWGYARGNLNRKVVTTTNPTLYMTRLDLAPENRGSFKTTGEVVADPTLIENRAWGQRGQTEGDIYFPKENIQARGEVTAADLYTKLQNYGLTPEPLVDVNRPDKYFMNLAQRLATVEGTPGRPAPVNQVLQNIATPVPALGVSERERGSVPIFKDFDPSSATPEQKTKAGINKIFLDSTDPNLKSDYTWDHVTVGNKERTLTLPYGLSKEPSTYAGRSFRNINPLKSGGFIAGALYSPEIFNELEKGRYAAALTKAGAAATTGALMEGGVRFGVTKAAQAGIAAPARALAAANPIVAAIATATLAPGSSRVTPAAAAAEQTAGKAQLLRAEAARKRGGKWGFPTPFGRLTIPELGLSEAGGLFFR
jgi:hypothetical protein